MTEINAELREKIQSFISTEQTFHIEAFDMENITKAAYGKEIEMLDSPNDTTHQFNVEKELPEWDEKIVKKAIEDRSLECHLYRVILNDLCKKEYIKPGRYFLRMSW